MKYSQGDRFSFREFCAIISFVTNILIRKKMPRNSSWEPLRDAFRITGPRKGSQEIEKDGPGQYRESGEPGTVKWPVPVCIKI